MNTDSISFLTPYWSGQEMMRIHLASIRRFYPGAPILVSKRGDDREEMESYRSEFGVRYWIEDCTYMDAYLRLLQRCETDYACILDHDAILLSGLDQLQIGIAEDRYDLVGIEERIREPAGMVGLWPQLHPNGWMRFAPGCTASNFILFNWRAFMAKWGLRGVIGTRVRNAKDSEFDYGIGQRLPRHKYLVPFHTRKYGLGNLLKHGDTAILWRQWFGSFRTRLVAGASYPDRSEMFSDVEKGERAFLADYPNLDFSGLVPAWGPERDTAEEQLAFARERRFGFGKLVQRGMRTLQRWHSYGLNGILNRAASWLDRWWRLR
jgi:hypothetical protein